MTSRSRLWVVWVLALGVLCLARPSRADSSVARSGERTVWTRLQNGLEVVLSEARQQPTFAMNLVYRVGGRHDPSDLDELAHLVEHLSFRFSRHSGKDGYTLADQAGITLNGYTHDDRTVFISSGPGGGLERMLWLERQRMAFSLERLSEKEVGLERRILDNERSTVRADRVGGMFWHFVGAELYPAGHPYAPRPERGCIERCQLQHAQWLMQRGYRPDNARLALVGDFDAEAMLKRVEQHFGSIGNPGVKLPADAVVPARVRRRRITIAAPVGRPSVQLLWEVPQALRAKRLALYVLRAELDALLEQDLVHGVGLATHVDIDLDELELGWLWSVDVELLPGVDPKRVEERVLFHLDRLRSQELNIERGRRATITGLLSAWDAPQARVGLLAHEPSLGFDLTRTIAEIGKISGSEVMRIARAFLREQPRLTVQLQRAADAARRGELYREGE